MKVRALIVEDDPRVRAELRRRLAAYPWIECVAESDAERESLEGVQVVLQGARDAEHRLKRLFIRQRGQLIPVSADEITHIEADGDYVRIHVAGTAHLVHLNMKQIRRRIDPERFVQVHRSHIVNLDHVTALRPHDDRRFLVSLRDGSSVLASRAGTQLLKSFTA